MKEKNMSGRKIRAIENTSNKMEKAKTAVLELSKQATDRNVSDLFYSDDLTEVENGVKMLNEMSERCWLLSAILIYSIVYDKEMYQKSGLMWEYYVKESKP